MDGLSPGEYISLGGLTAGEPNVDQISVLAYLFDVQFKVFVGDGIRVRLDSVVIGPQAANQISLICYPVSGKSHFGLVFGENISGPRLTFSQFSDFLGQSLTVADVGPCDARHVVSTELFGVHKTIFPRGTSRDVVIMHSLPSHSQDRLRELFPALRFSFNEEFCCTGHPMGRAISIAHRRLLDNIVATKYDSSVSVYEISGGTSGLIKGVINDFVPPVLVTVGREEWSLVFEDHEIDLAIIGRNSRPPLAQVLPGDMVFNMRVVCGWFEYYEQATHMGIVECRTGRNLFS